MVFSSYLFIFFFLPLALLGYYAAPKKLRHLTLTIFSYIFYGWANPWFCLLILFNKSVDYTNGRLFLLNSSPSTFFFIAGSPLVRQMPRAVESFSRNGSFILCSGISVFKNPRIIDK